MKVNCHLNDTESRWSPTVDVSWSRNGKIDVEIFTGKSFLTRNEAQEAGVEMAVNWIDSWKDL